MGFSTAIPVNSIAGAGDAFDASLRRDSYRKGWGSRVRQTVNISEETTLRIAREKLSRAIAYKVGYDRSGKVAASIQAGRIFSASA